MMGKAVRKFERFARRNELQSALPSALSGGATFAGGQQGDRFKVRRGFESYGDSGGAVVVAWPVLRRASNIVRLGTAQRRANLVPKWTGGVRFGVMPDRRCSPEATLGRRRFRQCLRWFPALVFVQALSCQAQSFNIEPDAYSEGTVLDHLLPDVHLTSAGADNLPIPPVPFEVTAVGDLLDFATTGTNVFGCANVPFWNSDRRMRMEFAAPMSWVMIDFAGGQYFANETGQLDGYNADNQKVASFTTAPLAAGHAETMTISRESGDIAWAVAYVPPGHGVFGRLDNLRFGGVVRIGLRLQFVDGGAVLTFTGPKDTPYRVWSSTNLSDWQILGVPTQGQPGQFVFFDAHSAGDVPRFYRVSVP